MTGQFSALLKGAGVRIDEEWKKYDGRRFYLEEMEARIMKVVSRKNRNILNWLKKIF